jgi:hypothetical protein
LDDAAPAVAVGFDTVVFQALPGRLEPFKEGIELHLYIG